jgi:16S rRNA G1207 methylase RsmC
MSKYTEEVVTNHFFNASTGEVEVQDVTITLREGVAIARTKHTTVIEPGADVSNYPATTQAMARAAWTPEHVQEWTEEFVALQARHRKQREREIAELASAVKRHEELTIAANEAAIVAEGRRKAAFELITAADAEMQRAQERVAEATAELQRAAELAKEVEKQRRGQEVPVAAQPKKGQTKK